MSERLALGAWLPDAWSRHGEAPEQVLSELPLAVNSVTEEGHVGRLTSLAAHVAGAHLGRWGDGIELVERLLEHPLCGESGQSSVWRSMAALYFCAGDSDTFETCLNQAGGTASDRTRVLAVAAGCLAQQRQTERAGAAFRSAAELAGGLKEDDPAVRALAIAANNLAAELEESDRDPAGNALMLESAEAALRWWGVAGTWLHRERAEYRLASCLVAADRTARAEQHARRCLAICAENDAEPIERLFGEEALARAVAGTPEADKAKARAHAHLVQISDAGLAAFCRSALDRL